jgi:hypothetical protein
VALKAVLIGPNGTVYRNGKIQTHLLADLVTFIQRMNQKGVHVGLWSQHPVTYTYQGKSQSIESYLSQASGNTVPFYQAYHGNLPTRQRAGSVDPILTQLGVTKAETILIGNEQTDMRAGVNNQLLLVRPEWYTSSIDYGFPVGSLSELAQFCEIFALRQHPIYWAVDAGDLHVRSMGPFSTMVPGFDVFGADARSVAKYGFGTKQFWFLMIVSSLYFSGLIQDVNYICPFPGHDPTSPQNDVKQGLDSLLTILGKCFRKDYMPDLILRHHASIKSQTAKDFERTFRNQLNTIRLNPYPHRYDRAPNKSSIQLKGKRVLIVDDFCTRGRSLDAARAYIEAAGGTTTLFSWLKTINTAFFHMKPDPPLQPFAANNIQNEPNSITFPYTNHIVNPAAAAEIDTALAAYRGWKWP